MPATTFADIWRGEYDDEETFRRFLVAYPEFERTATLTHRRRINFPEIGRYLDWTGAAKYGLDQLDEHFGLLREQPYGNPHSDSNASMMSTDAINEARRAVRLFLNASYEEYEVIFTSNATTAIQLVGAGYPFKDRHFVYLQDNHNSVLGVAKFATKVGGTVARVPISQDDLRLPDGALRQELDLRKCSSGLFAFSAQSNFSGVQYPLELIGQAKRHGLDVLLDAAAFVPTNKLDLTFWQPDFVALSLYKIIGYPTGIGCLVARKEALAKLTPPTFAGGTVLASSTQGPWHIDAEAPARFEAGTPNFLGLLGVSPTLGFIKRQIGGIHSRVMALTGWTLEQLAQLRHDSGQPMVHLYGPKDTQDRGATIAFNFLDYHGDVVDERTVSQAANDAGICLRTGCFCNPGAGEAAFKLKAQKLWDLGHAEDAASMTAEERLRYLDMPSGGAVRISFGNVSTFADAETFLRFAIGFRNFIPRPEQKLPDRSHC